MRGQIRDIRVPEEAPQMAVNLVRECLDVDPAKRPTMEQIIHTLLVRLLIPAWCGPRLHVFITDRSQLCSAAICCCRQRRRVWLWKETRVRGPARVCPPPLATAQRVAAPAVWGAVAWMVCRAPAYTRAAAVARHSAPAAAAAGLAASAPAVSATWATRRAPHHRSTHPRPRLWAQAYSTTRHSGRLAAQHWRWELLLRKRLPNAAPQQLDPCPSAKINNR